MREALLRIADRQLNFVLNSLSVTHGLSQLVAIFRNATFSPKLY
jgi:hypothetical protein